MIFVIKNPQLRRFLRLALPFVLIPAVVALGVFVFDEKSYGFIGLVVVLLSIALFCAGFEKRTVGTRRIIVIAVMTALSILGRFVFAPIPGFKPITAMIVITAIWLGGESGFLVGVLTVLISNFYFGHGPWTPFQMFAFGMIGLLAGLFPATLKKSRVALALYGVFAGVAFSCIMDVWSVLWYENGFRLQLYLGALLTAAPYMLSYAVSNVIFLLLLGRPFGEKLERIKIKYGV